jgi:endonuclease-3
LDLTVAVMLSAQTTDKQVNVVTTDLFSKYKTLEDYASADLLTLEEDLRKIGLFRGKAKNIKTMAGIVLTEFNGIIPDTIEKLITLPGIGRKTANVVISVGYGKPGFAVDTHVERISKRLTLVKQTDSIAEIEQKLKRRFPRDKWSKLHHQMIFFGRYFCIARKPQCEICVFQKVCTYYKAIKK